MFPNFGKAYIEAICQYYNLTKEKQNIENELQRIVGIILNNQLPRELLNMNQSAQTLRELYVWMKEVCSCSLPSMPIQKRNVVVCWSLCLVTRN